MELLPSNVCSIIFSHIPYYDLLKLRVVNKWFNEQISRETDAITFVQLTREREDWRYKQPIEYPLKLKEPLGYVCDRNQLPAILSLVKSKFPALEALDTVDMTKTVALSHLVPLARNLKYLKAYKLRIDIPYESVQDVMDLFPSLQAFCLVEHIVPFCPRMWAGRSNFIQWSNVCDHFPPCEGTCDPPNATHKYVELANLSAVQLYPSAVASTLEVLVLNKLNVHVPTLNLPNLNYFSIENDEDDLENYMFIDFLRDAPNVRNISVAAKSGKRSTTLSFLSFVNSLPQIENIDLRINGLTEECETYTYQVFAVCKKPRLSQVFVQLARASAKGDSWTSEHNTLIQDLFDSSGFFVPLEITCMGIFDSSLFHLKMDYAIKGCSNTLFLDARDPVFLKQWLKFLVPRFSLQMSSLVLFSLKGIDASFVADVLKCKNLQKLNGSFTEEFITRWLPLFTSSDNKKNLVLELYISYEPARETHDSLIEAINDGRLKNFETKWICPLETECTCSLQKRPRYTLSDFLPLFTLDMNA